jgi:hypothetical protein
MGMILNLDLLKKIKPLFVPTKTNSRTINFYSPTSSSTYEYSRQSIRQIAKPTLKAEVISFVPLEEITTETLEVSKFLAGHDLYDTLEMRLFDELALEPSLEYKICFDSLEERDSQETKKYNTFVATYPAIRQKMSGAECEYIDFIFMPQSTIKTLFGKNFLSDSSTFAFIYLYNDSAYLCVYQNGHYTYSKSIRASLKALTDRFSEILGERVDLDDFIKIITNTDFRAKKPEYSIGFKTILEEFFTAISDILVHAKRINQISGYEAIYISTEHGNIADINKIAKEYFETPFLDFDFNLGLKTDGFVDMSTRLMIFAYLNDIQSYDNMNFSIFMRPPPLFKRAAGIFMGISTVALLLSSVYPLYNVSVAGAYYSFKTNSLNKELSALKKEQSGIENQKMALQIEQTKLTKQNDSETKKYTETLQMLQELESKRLSSNSIAAQTATITETAANSKVSLRKIDTNATNTLIECKAGSAAMISNFSKKLWLASGRKTSADKIEKDGNSTGFVGQISMEGVR